MWKKLKALLSKRSLISVPPRYPPEINPDEWTFRYWGMWRRGTEAELLFREAEKARLAETKK